MIAFLLSIVLSWLLLRGLVPQLRRRLLDYPNQRSSHHIPTPRGGGVVFVVIASVSSGFVLFSGGATTLATLPLLAAPLAIVGLLDDRYNLSPIMRYAAQLFTAALLLAFSPPVQGLVLSTLPKNWFLLLIVLPLLITVTAVINFTNFMDGLDGLVGGCMAVAISSLSIQLSAPWNFWVLVGALVGFLFWNWSPSKVFMGDVGSTFLGSIFAGLALQAFTLPEALGLLLVCTPLMADASLCVLRRFFAGHNIFKAHRLHLFQRLHQAGWTHAQVSITYILATFILSVSLFVGGLPLVCFLALVELMVGVCLDQHLAVPFAESARS